MAQNGVFDIATAFDTIVTYQKGGVKKTINDMIETAYVSNNLKII